MTSYQSEIHPNVHGLTFPCWAVVDGPLKLSGLSNSWVKFWDWISTCCLFRPSTTCSSLYLQNCTEILSTILIGQEKFLINITKSFYMWLGFVRAWTSVLPGHIGFWHFWQVPPHEEFEKMVLISFEHLKKISNFPKLQGCGSKNEPAMPISNLSLNST